jgi:hypothetical protein
MVEAQSLPSHVHERSLWEAFEARMHCEREAVRQEQAFEEHRA